MNRLEWMSAILVKLQSRPLVTAREIAGQFAVSLRTVYCDIRSLEESVVPICGEAGAGYSLADWGQFDPAKGVKFSNPEGVNINRFLQQATKRDKAVILPVTGIFQRLLMQSAKAVSRCSKTSL